MNVSPRRLRPWREASQENETSRQTFRQLATRGTRRNGIGRTNNVNAGEIEEVENNLVVNHDNGIVSFIDLTRDPLVSPVRLNRHDSLPPLEIPSPRTQGLPRNSTSTPVVSLSLGGMIQHFRRVQQIPSAMITTVDLTESADESKESICEFVNDNEVMNDNSNSEGGGLVIECPVCLHSLQTLKRRGSSIMSTMCGHLFCSRCLPLSLRNNGRCPTCRKLLGMTGYHQVFI